MGIVPEHKIVRAVNADAPKGLATQFVALATAELMQEILESNPAAVVRSVSTEAVVRFHRYRKVPFFGYDIANGPLFLTTRFRCSE